MAFDEINYIGKQIGGNYRLIAKINSGTYGDVYKAQHIVFRNAPIVAIKLIRTRAASEEEYKMIFQEAHLLKTLQHPHVLPILDAGVQDDFLYIVMEYAEGGSLRDRLRRQNGQPLPLEEAFSILKQIGEALHYAHQLHIVHRDLKPDNILFNAKGAALLADFGIAAILTSGTKDLGRGGTPIYMAPEQFEGKVSTKSDQYALGYIAYELVTGRKPFDIEGAGLEVVWYHHTKVIPANPKQYNSRLSDNVAQAILMALAKQRINRYKDILSFTSALSVQKTAKEWFEEGVAFLNSRKYDEAILAYDEAIKLQPNYTTAHLNKGATLGILKRYEEAVKTYEEATQLQPNNADAHNNKGLALAELGRYSEAVKAYDEVIRLRPGESFAYYNKGKALAELARYEGALRAFEKVIQLKPTYAVAYFNKGKVLTSLGNTEEALKAFEEAIRLNPNDANAYNDKGLALAQLGRTVEAQQAFEKAKELGYKVI